MTHTPGPWEIESTVSAHYIESEGCEVARVDLIGAPEARVLSDNVDLANARLIKAAPELLAIAQHLADAQRDGAQEVYFGALFGDDDITTLGDAVTAAIAKAEEDVTQCPNPGETKPPLAPMQSWFDKWAEEMRA
jgi:hypothetical protein